MRDFIRLLADHGSTPLYVNMANVTQVRPANSIDHRWASSELVFLNGSSLYVVEKPDIVTTKMAGR